MRPPARSSRSDPRSRTSSPANRVLIPAITPDWNSLEAQAGYSMHSGGMLAGWKFSNFKDGVFSEYFHVNDADGNLAKLPESIDPGDACILSDMVPTGFHAVELADVQLATPSSSSASAPSAS